MKVKLCPRQAVAEALKQNRTVTALDLGVNEIGDEGAKACSQHTPLEILRLGTACDQKDSTRMHIDMYTEVP